MVHQIFRDDDEVPQDINAFFIHPLNSSLRNDDGATALLHEYKSLPAIDKTSDENSNDTECVEAQQVKDLSEDECGVLSLDDECKGQKLLCIDENADTMSPQMATNGSDFMGEALDIDNDTLDEILSLESDGGQMFGDYLATPSPALPTLANDKQEELAALMADCKDAELASASLESLPDLGAEAGVDVKLADERLADAEVLALKCEPLSPPAAEVPSPTATQPVPAFNQSKPEPNQPQVTLNQPYQFQQNMAPNPPQYMYPVAPHTHAVVNQAAGPPMPYTMAPRFLHPMVVETSTGHLHLQPFISHDGQIGITPVTPYHPQLPTLPPVHMGMAWNPSCYPGTMPAPEAMHIPPQQTVYSGVQQYVPLGSIQHQAGTITPVVQTQFACNNNSLATTKLNQQLPKSSTDEMLPKTEAHAKASCNVSDNTIQQQNTDNTAKELSSKIAEGDSANLNTLQKACALSNIPLISTATCDKLTTPVPGANHFLKSPDSGFGEAQADVTSCSSEYEVSVSNPGSPTTNTQRLKRRRSSMCSHSRQTRSSGTDAVVNFSKREKDDTGYEIMLEVPTSCGAKLEEDRMTYLNKGQLYTLVIHNTLPLAYRSTYVKSVVTLRFRDESNMESVSKNWYYWCTRQPESNPKAIELDLKDSEGIVDNSLEYNGVNSLTFSWLPQECVKVQLAVHCLSTDFSSQKGVKGLPLHIQIDTYDDINASSNQPVHRAYAQIKIFCDKGAERKARDEEKRKDKSIKPVENPGAKPEQYHSIEEKTHFYSMFDLFTDVHIYKPPALPTDTFDLPFRDLMASGDPLLLSDGIVPSIMENDMLFPPNHKRLKMNEVHQVFLYVREVDDSAFTGLVLESQTVLGLCSVVQEKFTFISHINNLFKRTSKGMLVRLDDKLVKHLMHESSYVIEFKKLPSQDYDVILTETDE